MIPLFCTECHETISPSEIRFATTRQQAGCFCDVCEAFCFFNDAQKRPTYKLLLEKKSTHNETLTPNKPPIKFDKRLSPLRYPGGKTLLIDYTYQQLNQNQCETLFSPFAGGASVELALLQSGVVNHLVLNDLDEHLMNFYHQAIYNTAELITYIDSNPLTIKFYEKSHINVNIPFNPQNDRIEAAYHYLINNRCSFSGIFKAGRLGGKNGSLQALSARWNPSDIIKRLWKLHALRDRITLTQLDFRSFIETYAWQSGTFFIDPPYLTDQAHAIYRHAFNHTQHFQLFDTLNQFYHSYPNADFLVYYDNHPDIHNYPIPDDVTIINRKYSIC